MQILTAAVSGMCFGVRDALAAAESVAEPRDVVIHGELVHNPVVNAHLEQRGFLIAGEAGRHAPPALTPLTVGGRPVAAQRSTVLITAHGVSDRERQRLADSGRRIIDTTCPLVRRAHRAAQMLGARGYHVIVIGKRGHVEVEGLMGDLDSVEVIEHAGEVRPAAHPRIGIVCQTTSVMREVDVIVEAVRAANPAAEVRFVDTVCQPTRQRQRALERLLDVVDVAVIVGGRHSNNTRKLVQRCAERGVRAIHVEGPGELSAEQFRGVGCVGLTAGTSTLPETLAAVRGELEAIAGWSSARRPRGGAADAA